MPEQRRNAGILATRADANHVPASSGILERVQPIEAAWPCVTGHAGRSSSRIQRFDFRRSRA